LPIEAFFGFRARSRDTELLEQRGHTAYMLTVAKPTAVKRKSMDPGLAEMIRMLAEANVIPQKEPWQSFVLE
jgi:hypothetical protein